MAGFLVDRPFVGTTVSTLTRFKARAKASLGLGITTMVIGAISVIPNG